MEMTTCPTCAGFAVTRPETGSLLTCPSCGGKGLWFTNTNTKLYLGIPQIISPKSPQRQALSRLLIKSGKVACLSTTAISLGAILWQGPSTPLDVIWAPGISHAIFGASGLGSMWALSHWRTTHASSQNLYELPDLQAQQTESIDVLPYTNQRVSELLELAAYKAQTLGSSTVSDEILLLTLLEHPRIQTLLARLEEPPEQLVEAASGLLSRGTDGHVGSITLQPVVRQRLLRAFELSLAYHFPYVDLEDILLAFAESPARAASIFTQFGVTQDLVYAASCWYAEEVERSRRWAFWLEQGRNRPKGFMNRAWTALPTPYLDQFSTDITRLAGAGGVAPGSVREKEIDHVLEILGGSHKSSVVLVGEPGVGKSTVLGAIALRMLEERVPESLRDRRFLQVDLSALLQSEGTPEKNMQRALEEVQQAGNIILAIPDVQSLIGTSQGAQDAGGILANALNQGYLQVITTANHGDYHRYVESNQNLSNLLTQVEISPLSIPETIRVLEEEAPAIESRQHVYLTYPTLLSAAEFANRYLPDQPLPGSALQLLDEAASQAALAGKSWVRHQEVEQAIQKRTNIPVGQASSQEADKLLHFEEYLHSRVIGQQEAVSGISEALRRSRAGLRDTKRPIASFLFVGPTGVGKTEMAKAVADLYFSGESNIVRLDMSEYQDNTAVYRLIGAPAADSESYTEGGALTQPIREHPFSLILLDELEKADPEVLNIFLQLLEDGRLTENSGRTVFFTNCIIIATSNAGSAQLVQQINQGVRGDELHAQSLNLLQGVFKPEFLNRFDAIIPFTPLSQEELQQVTTLMLREVVEAAKAQGIALSFTPEAVAKLAQLGYDPQYGARPLRRIIQDKAEGLLAKMILQKQLGKGSTLQITPDMLQ